MDGAARLQRLEGFLAEDPHNRSLLGEVFDLALQGGDLERAARHLARSEQAAPDGGDAAWDYRRALLHGARGDGPAALAALQACTSQLASPWPAAVQVLWLRLQHRAGRLEEAWHWVEAARLQDVLHPAAAAVASLVAIDLDRPADALALADRSLAQEGAPVEALVARGTVALAQRDARAAIAWLQRAQQDPSARGRAVSALGLAYLLEQDFTAAGEQLQQAVQRLPRHVGSWLALGWTRWLAGDAQAALDAFRHAVDLDPAFAESQAAVGLVLAVAGDAQADAWLARAERLDRGSVTARYARALLAGDARDLPQLQRLARRILDRDGLFGGRLSDWVTAGRPGRSG